jgi:hypothetical protein
MADIIPTDSALTGAHIPDNLPAPTFIRYLPSSVKYLLADGGYDDQWLRDLCEQPSAQKIYKQRAKSIEPTWNKGKIRLCFIPDCSPGISCYYVCKYLELQASS